MNDQLLVAVGVTIVLSVVFFLLRNRLAFIPPLQEPALPPANSEAERLARLLVGELRLYNIQEVEAVARGESEPSEDLCGEVASSRAVYRERVPPGEQADHFETAVLHILAAGNPTICAKLLRRGQESARQE